MTTAVKGKKVADMTVDELQDMIRGIVQEAIDPDHGLELREEFIAEVQASQKSIERGEGIPLEEVKKRLGIA